MAAVAIESVEGTEKRVAALSGLFLSVKRWSIPYVESPCSGWYDE